MIGDGYAGGYEGGIDEVAVYDRALTPAEVVEHFAAMVRVIDAAYGDVVSGDAPVSYWRLDEATGPVAVDETGANPGLYQGTPGYGEPGAIVRRRRWCWGRRWGFRVMMWCWWVMLVGWRVMCRMSCG